MTQPGPATNNTAGSGSTVGIQADEVRDSTVYHNSTVYQLLPDAPPNQKYKIGVRYLDDGVPARARDLLGEVIAHGYDDAEVRFHWVLAMLSKRAYRDLTLNEREQLVRTSDAVGQFAEDEWKRALEAVRELLDHLEDSESDPGLALKKLLALPPRQRDKIVRHLDLVITGGMKDALWAESREEAKRNRCSGDRLKRVWAYFHPEPIPPRVRKPDRISTTPGDWIWAVTCSGVFVIVFGYLGLSVFNHAMPLPILAYFLVLAAGYVVARTGLEWRYLTERLRVKDHDYFGQRLLNRAPEDGFANGVARSLRHYFALYVPRGSGREAWLADTAGIRTTLRDEIVELYRESRISVDRVEWLIRHMASRARTRREEGTLLEHREQYRTPASTRVWCALSLVTLIFAAASVIDAALQTDPLPAVIATLAAVTSGRVAAMRWLHIISERRRLAEEYREYDRLVEERDAAYQRWKKKLDSTRPSEKEMEAWLDCDKTILLDQALRHYGLAWRDIIAHAFLQTPANQCKRARVPGGLWRYSKYDIRVFLITEDGVREVSTQLNFERAELNGQKRNNFRFDAVSSVHVSKTDDYSHTLELSLMNGPTQDIQVTDPAPQHDPSESLDMFSEINLDAAGFTHTLHILEGIAAEGKGWIDRDPHVKINSDGSRKYG